MTSSQSSPEPHRWEVFYADPVDEDGNVIATAHLEITHATGGDAIAVKVPHSELGIDPDMPTIRADLADLEDPEDSDAS